MKRDGGNLTWGQGYFRPGGRKPGQPAILVCRLMNRISSVRNIENPHIYFELGKLISSVGHDHFVTNMHQLIATSVSISLVELSEWTTDDSQGSVIDIQSLGNAGLPEELTSPPLPCSITPRQRDEHPLMKSILEVDDSILIHMNAPMMDAKGYQLSSVSHQCSLVSGKGNRRCVISLHRPLGDRDFSLSELSFLKNLSETLLPLVERHARISRQVNVRKAGTPIARPVVAFEQTPLQRDFNERLTLCDVALSAREKEVCLGLLTGGTVPEMAEKLCVKNSSVETYLKRAAAKLGVSGRHGLAKWMIGA